MSLFASPRFLPLVLRVDALSGVVTALLHLVGGSALAGWLGLPPALVLATGAALWVYVAAAGWASFAQPVPRGLVGALIVCNWAWAVGCLALLVTSAGITPLGQAYLAVQAMAVVVFAEVEWLGLRRYPVRGWA